MNYESILKQKVSEAFDNTIEKRAYQFYRKMLFRVGIIEFGIQHQSLRNQFLTNQKK